MPGSAGAPKQDDGLQVEVGKQGLLQGIAESQALARALGCVPPHCLENGHLHRVRISELKVMPRQIADCQAQVIAQPSCGQDGQQEEPTWGIVDADRQQEGEQTQRDDARQSARNRARLDMFRELKQILSDIHR